MGGRQYTSTYNWRLGGGGGTATTTITNVVMFVGSTKETESSKEDTEINMERGGVTRNSKGCFFLQFFMDRHLHHCQFEKSAAVTSNE